MLVQSPQLLYKELIYTSTSKRSTCTKNNTLIMHQFFLSTVVLLIYKHYNVQLQNDLYCTE